eukprot:3847924-Pyramimonas_sp.AAC.1
MAPRSAQEAPRVPQDGPKRSPRGPQEAPKKIPNGHKRPPEAPKTPKSPSGRPSTRLGVFSGWAGGDICCVAAAGERASS